MKIAILMNGLFCVILLLATVSNSLLLLVFYRRPGLRTISNRFVINLLVTNLITCWILIPLLLFDNVWREIGGSANILFHYISLCPIKEGVAVGLCTSTIFSVLMIGIDQYYAVVDPLRYHNFINATTSTFMILSSWLISILFVIIGSFAISYKSTWYICQHLEPVIHIPAIYQSIFPILFAILIFFLPFGTVCWIYFSIYSAAHENSLRTRRNGSTVSCMQQDSEYVIIEEQQGNNTPEFKKSINSKLPESPDFKKMFSTLHHSSTKSSLKSTSSSIVNSLKHRISNASMFRYREETRAARISALVIVMALFCWFPFVLLMILRSPLINITLSHYAKQLGILLLSANSVMSPLIFAHRNRRIHKELCKIFCISKRRTSYYDYDNNFNNNNKNNNNKSAKKNLICKKHGIIKSNKNNIRANGGAEGLLLNIDGNNSTHKSTSLSCLPNKKKRSVSILNKVWIISNKSNEHIETSSLKVPDVALEVDTARSSFSSNSSNTTTTSTASCHSIVIGGHGGYISDSAEIDV